MPFEAREAHMFFELNVRPSFTELYHMPNDFVELLELYQSVVHVIQYGGNLDF
jgi:hypothetical protein